MNEIEKKIQELTELKSATETALKESEVAAFLGLAVVNGHRAKDQ